MVKSICIILFLLVSNLSLVIAQAASEKDTISKLIHINKIEMEFIKSKGLFGMQLTMAIQDTLVIANNLNIDYKINGTPYTRLFFEVRPLSITRIPIFHPFTHLFKIGGSNTISFELDSIYIPKQKEGFNLLGVKTKSMPVEVPPIRTIRTKVNYVKVNEINPKGKAWDYNFFASSKSDNYPDLIYTVESIFNEDSRGIFNGQFYRGHKQKNTVVASWNYFSDVIYYCEGDELFLCIKDADTVFHDEIGCIALDQLIEQEKKEKLQFGSVLSFSYEVIFE